MGARNRPTRLRVLQSFRPNPATNPYLLQLAGALESYVTVSTFSWRSAVLGDYDVWHVHWPEVLLRGRTAPRSVVRSSLFLLALVVARLRRRAIVRTLHNLRPHEPLDRVRGAIVALCDRWTSAWITLTPVLEPPTAAPCAVIPHGHYRDWYHVDESVAAEPGRVLFFGHVRRYKGVDDLLAVLPDVDVTPFSLRIVGRPYEDDLVAAIGETAADDDRLTARLEFVDDAELAGEIVGSELVVLPYRSLVNSGAMLLALSLGRPVLVPEGASTAELASEVGEAWVMTYPPPLCADHLAGALRRAGGRRDALPDLSARDWDRVAAAHSELYCTAVQAARR